MTIITHSTSDLPSSSTTTTTTTTNGVHTQDSTELLKQHVKELIARKDRLEEEMQEIIQTLETSNAGVSEPLVDSAGFPRSDVDLNQARELRHMLAIRRTDLAELIADIEQGMLQLHQATRAEQSAAELAAASLSSSDSESAVDHGHVISPQLAAAIPFAVVNAVAPDSPAAACGLKAGDQVLQFGDIVKQDIDVHGLKLLGEFVSHRVNQVVSVHVSRPSSGSGADSRATLRLVPREWSGRGYLGCHLVPLSHRQ